MATFTVPFVSSNPYGWGPPDIDESNPNAPGNVAKFAALPYSPFGRSDRLGRAADFASTGRGGGFRRRDNDRRRDVEEPAPEAEETFQLVDTTKTAPSKRFMNPINKRRQQSHRLRQVNARRQQPSSGATMDRVVRNAARGGGRGRGGPGRGFGGRGYNARVDRQPSVAVQSDWVKVDEMDLGKITKNLVINDIPDAEDLLWCGFLDHYYDVYDKISARQPQPLKRIDNRLFYPVTTTDDPVLENLAIEGKGQVFITDAIMSHLMTCTRSIFPWDIVVQKLPGGTLFFDKRDNSHLDYLTVHETAAFNPPADDDSINSASRLSLEATVVCQNFSQQILKKTGRKEMELPNPFFDEEDAQGMEPASVAYRYRRWKLDASTTLVCRTELHGLVKEKQYMTAYALNEFVAGTSQIGTWRDRIDAQRGAVLANELKNNAFKLAKWTAQSLLAGADQMKIGFVTRANPKVPHEHVILGTQFYRPKDFAQQITLNEPQMWAVFRMFVSLFQKLEQGKYVLMRDPNKPLLYIYRVPQDTFDDEE